MALLNPGGAIAQFQRNDCSISPVEVIWRGGVHILLKTPSQVIVTAVDGAGTTLALYEIVPVF